MPHLFADDRPPAVLVAALGDLGGAIGAALGSQRADNTVRRAFRRRVAREYARKRAAWPFWCQAPKRPRRGTSARIHARFGARSCARLHGGAGGAGARNTAARDARRAKARETVSLWPFRCLAPDRHGFPLRGFRERRHRRQTVDQPRR